jgi:hypothetical protein
VGLGHICEDNIQVDVTYIEFENVSVFKLLGIKATEILL